MEHPSLIQAVTVNHNTSRYVELLLRSLYAKHTSELNMAITVMDNGSGDDMTDLLQLLEEKAIPLYQSGFNVETKVNSHGEVLAQFVLEHPYCRYYLFLDADVCFIEDSTIDLMMAQLEADNRLFGVGVRQTWDGQEEIPTEIHQAIYFDRLHPCCALVKNTPLFRCIVEEIGFTGVTYHWVAGEKYVDTFELMTRVMKTHGLYHSIVPKMVYHFFSVSYDDQWMESKNQRRDRLLETLRIE